MSTARETAERGTKAYMNAYAYLTNVRTNMYATERRALDESPLYSDIIEKVLHGRASQAVELVTQFRDERGDAWRAKAADCGLIPTSDFVNEV